MESKYACVIDKNGNYINFVLIEQIPKYALDGTFSWWEKPHGYKLREGEALLSEYPPLMASKHPVTGKITLPSGTMLKPRWNGAIWEESATPEEIQAVSAEQAEPITPPPTEMELLAVEMTMALAQIQKSFDMAIAELSMAMSTKGGTDNV